MRIYRSWIQPEKIGSRFGLKATFNIAIKDLIKYNFEIILDPDPGVEIGSGTDGTEKSDPDPQP